MSKKPVPKKRRARSTTRAQHSEFQRRQIRRLSEKQPSPFAAVAEKKNKADKALKSVTKIKA